MRSNLLKERLSAIIDLLKAVHQGGSGMSAASVGYEREAVANALLGNVIAPPYRLGSGDILDSHGERSGQMDIVVERTPSISFPLVNGLHPRLYLAEGVAAVVEVKSDLPSQWHTIAESHERLVKLRRRYEEGGVRIGEISEHIPYFVVGYKGWQEEETLRVKADCAKIAGVLSINPDKYCSRRENPERYECISGPIALARFMVEVEVELRRLAIT
jgi:hypothetical protein